MAKDSKESQQIEDHKKMLMFSGNLSDFQLKNIKTWPMIVYREIDEATVTYDFEGIDGGQSAGSVSYLIKLKNEEEEKNLKIAEESLTNWVKFLFWDETTVSFKYE